MLLSIYPAAAPVRADGEHVVEQPQEVQDQAHVSQVPEYPNYHNLAFEVGSYDGIAAPSCLHETYHIPMLILSYLSPEDIRDTFWFDRGIVLFLETCLGFEASMVRF